MLTVEHRAKNVPWHILAPSAVACDMFLLRASAHPAERFLCHRTKFPMTQKSSVLIGISPLEDEGSNILRVTTSVAGVPAPQSHPPSAHSCTFR